MRWIILFLSGFFGIASAQSSPLEKMSGAEDLPITIDAEEKIQCEQEKNVCIATKNAQAQRGDRTVYGDKLLVHFSPGKSATDREVIALEAEGHVRFKDPTRTAFGDHAYYRVPEEYMILTGKNLKIVTPDQRLIADRSIEYFDQKKKAVVKGNAIFTQKDRLVRGDVLTAHFKAKSGSHTLSSSQEDLMLDFVVAEGHVVVSTPQQSARGNWGRYDAKTEHVYLKDNVKIVQGENIIQGAYATVDLKTNKVEIHTSDVFPVMMPSSQVSSILPRVRAILVPRDLKHQKSLPKKSSVYESR